MVRNDDVLDRMFNALNRLVKPFLNYRTSEIFTESLSDLPILFNFKLAANWKYIICFLQLKA